MIKRYQLKMNILQKKCAECGIIKSTNNFGKDKQKKSGIDSYCLSCRKIKRDFYIKNNQEKNKIRHKKYYEKIKNYSITREKYLQHKAHLKVTCALKSGLIKKESCKICGDNKTDAHHYLGYQPNNWMDIIWLCRKHHFYVHR